VFPVESQGRTHTKTTTAAPHPGKNSRADLGRLANLTFHTIQIGIIVNTFAGLSFIGSAVLLWFGSSLVISKEYIGQLFAFNG